jgi:hypothetical protein
LRGFRGDPGEVDRFVSPPRRSVSRQGELCARPRGSERRLPNSGDQSVVEIKRLRCPSPCRRVSPDTRHPATNPVGAAVDDLVALAAHRTEVIESDLTCRESAGRPEWRRYLSQARRGTHQGDGADGLRALRHEGVMPRTSDVGASLAQLPISGKDSACMRPEGQHDAAPQYRARAGTPRPRRDSFSSPHGSTSDSIPGVEGEIVASRPRLNGRCHGSTVGSRRGSHNRRLLVSFPTPAPERGLVRRSPGPRPSYRVVSRLHREPSF